MLVGLASWNAILVGFYLWQGPEATWIGWTGSALGPLSSLISVIWTVVATSPVRRQRRRALAERALTTAYQCYLRDNLRGAWIAVEKGLRGTQDDADLLFLAWVLARRLNDGRRVRRLQRRLRHYDVEEKWSWQMQREEALGHGSP